MKPNIENIRKLVANMFGNNKAAFARAIGVDRSQVSRILNHGWGAGARFFGGLFKLCSELGLNFNDYVFLPNHMNKVNTKESKRLVGTK